MSLDALPRADSVRRDEASQGFDLIEADVTGPDHVLTRPKARGGMRVPEKICSCFHESNNLSNHFALGVVILAHTSKKCDANTACRCGFCYRPSSFPNSCAAQKPRYLVKMPLSAGFAQ